MTTDEQAIRDALEQGGLLTWMAVAYYNTPEEAHEVYKQAAIESFGEFARFE